MSAGLAIDTSFTAAKLQTMQFAPIKWIVPGYFVEGLTLLAAKPKVGKSWLMLHVAISVARGGFTLGDKQCAEGDVLYCALEDNPRRLKSRMRKLLQSQPWPERLKFECSIPRLKSGGVMFVRKWIDNHPHARLVVIDTLAKVRDPKGAQQSNYEADYDAVSELKALADEKGIAIVLVHHQRKMTADEWLDTVSGTTGLTGAVDSILALVWNSTDLTLHGVGRDLPEIEDAVEFDRQACIWRVLGKAADVRRSDERSTILEALREAGEELSAKDICTVTGMKNQNVRFLLSRMAKEGDVLKGKRGKYKHPAHAAHITNGTHIEE